MNRAIVIARSLFEEGEKFCVQKEEIACASCFTEKIMQGLSRERSPTFYEESGGLGARNSDLEWQKILHQILLYKAR